MKIILDFNKNSCVMYVKSNSKVEASSDIKKIMDFVDNLTDDCISINFKNNEKISILYPNGNKLILKGDIKAFSKNNIFKMMNQKIKKIYKINLINKKRINALIGAVILCGSIAINKLIVEKSDNPTETYEDIIEDDLRNENFKSDYLETIPVEPTFDLNLKETYPYKTTINPLSKEPLKLEAFSDLPERLEQFKEKNNDEYIMMLYVDFIESNNGKKCFQLCKEFGVDPYVILAMFMIETGLDHKNTIPDGNRFNGNGIGIGQIEKINIGHTISAYNANGELKEKMVTAEALNDIDNNMEIAIMIFKNVLDKYKGNVSIAVQSYNYGQGLMDFILKLYADQTNKTVDEVIKDYDDLGWLRLVEFVNDNPNSFAKGIDIIKYKEYTGIINFLKNWTEKTYGGKDYLKKFQLMYMGNYYYVLNAQKVY